MNCKYFIGLFGILIHGIVYSQPSGFPIGDVSGMFNERGFVKSNSYSYEENEIINDFNGNLQFNFPLANKEGPGDIYLDLSLTYNGSINYQIIAANINYASFNYLPKYNVNAPGWLFSLNGMAIQMFTFETNFFTSSSASVDSITSNNCRLLATGYHITDRLSYAASSGNDRDAIYIMRGDGSVITLKRIPSDTCTGVYPECYSGEYYSDNIGEYIRGYVEYIEPGVEPVYRNRRLHLMKGDGLTYIYEEYKTSYYDFPLNTGSLVFRPQMFLLKKIKDRYGNLVELIYDNTVTEQSQGLIQIKGRPIISKISCYNWKYSDITFTYDILGGIASMVTVNTGNGSYKIEADGFTFQSDGNHRPSVKEIKNPAGEKTTFTNTSYRRTADNVYSPYENQYYYTKKLKFIFNRLTKIINYNGGIREYTYIGGNTERTVNMKPPEYENSISSDSIGVDYFGQGRDIFFTNMLNTKTVKNQDKDNIYSETFTYGYTLGNSREWKLFPVDTSDIYTTTRETESSENENFPDWETPEYFKTEKTYKNFVIYIGYRPNQEVPDFIGHTKLIGEKQYVYSGSSQELLHETLYKFVRTGTGNNTGSFLDTAVITKINGIEKKRSIRYEHSTEPLTNTDNNPVIRVESTDELGQKRYEHYNVLYSECIHYLWARYKPDSGSNQEYDTTYIYLNGLTDTINIYSPGNSLMYKETRKYSSNTDVKNNDSTFFGQLLNTRVYDINNLSVYKQTLYGYFHNDTIGKSIYEGTNNKPSTEGKLKSVTSPNGNTTLYFYHPIYNEIPSYPESYPVPKIRCIYATDSGTDSTELISIDDSRMPVMTRQQVNSGYYYDDFMEYTPEGNISRYISADRYSYNLYYDGSNRIKTIITPYDFNYSPEYFIDSLIIDTTYYEVTRVVKANAFGTKDMIDSPDYYINYNNLNSGTLNGFKWDYRLGIIIPGGPPPENPEIEEMRLYMLIQFPDTTFNGFSDITGIQLKLFPCFYEHKVNGDTSNSLVNLRFYPVTDVNYNSQNHFLDVSYEGYSCKSYIESYGGIPCTDTSFIENIIDVTDILKRSVINESNSFKGLFIDATHTIHNPVEEPEQEYSLSLSYCIENNNNISLNDWKDYYCPVLYISGTVMNIDSTRIKVFKKGTYLYEYDDEKDITKMYSKLDGQTNKEVHYEFDEYYRLKKTKSFNSQTEFDSTFSKYNYLSKVSSVTDGRGNLTKSSYDRYLNNSKNVFADNSYTLDTIIFQNGLSYTFGTVSGLITKQVFTDEVGNNFEKYLDAVGNLRREIKYNESAQLITDYKYDDLYRVTEVRTPSDKRIYYEYDGLGRQSSRSTPDAGMVRYKYDRNDNIRFSQDRNQYNKPTEYPPGKYITFRGYDGLNRLLYIGDTYTENYLTQWESLNPNPGQNYGFENYSLSPENFLVINVYDTLVNYPANANIFTSPPQDYYSEKNNTKGSLCATAYRTLGTDGWNFKYYRYDARGRVKKMWNYINGFGWKKTEYEYNSQNQVTEIEYQTTSDNDHKVFSYEYDKSGRLKISATDETRPPLPFAEYRYNQNSQIDSIFYSNGSYYITNYYNNRNWVTQSSSSNNKLNYMLDYLANGNIGSQYINGDYKGNFSDTKEFRVNYFYDNSNRLTEVERFSTKYFDLSGEYSFDPDGNFLTLTRSYNSDNFSYDYYSGTNKLKKVSGSTDQFTYDYNGNMINDYFNNNTDIKYDHRNLITEITRINELEDPPATYTTTYKYDEGGNRINKKITKDDGSTMEIIVNEYYIRDVSGKEIGIYQNDTLKFWNVWGLGNEGRITSDGTRYYYIKDHLGSIRAVLNDNNDLVEAIDYDPWGHIARYWTSSASKYKFTGKERDNETGYDYFGARYYDSRIGNWTSTDPLFEKHIQWSPYNYVLRNGMKLIDIGGFIPRVTISGNTIIFEFSFYYSLFENDKNKGLNEEQIIAAKNIVEDMGNWSGKFAMEGIEYNMEIKTTISSMEGEYDIAASEKLLNDKYVNFIINAENDTETLEDNQGVGIREEVLELLRGEKLNPYKSTGSHELGHYFKLTHGDVKSRTQIIDETEITIESIMGRVTIFNNKEYRDYPSNYERELVFKRNANYFTK